MPNDLNFLYPFNVSKLTSLYKCPGNNYFYIHLVLYNRNFNKKNINMDFQE